MESLAYSGAFDCFTQFHRAQYFHIPDGDKTTGLEKIIGYAQTKNSVAGSSNTLFGSLSDAMEIPVPKIPNREPWTLTEKLEYEKEVTGMFMSGHPLDHFKFELKYYNIVPLNDFNEIKESSTLAQANLSKTLRIAGLVIDAQHRVTKTGRNFGILTIEDFNGKTELALWSDDYMKFTNYLDKGKNLLITGFFKTGWKKEGEPDKYEFKITSINLLETAKQTLTRSIEISMHVASVNEEMVTFFDKNIKSNPGKSSLRFNIVEPTENLVVSLFNNDRGFSMNEDMAEYLLNNPDVEVSVGLAG